MTGSPFRALGLDADPGLTDDDVRAAWHRVAAVTHPDRADGGDPAAFRAAAAAYSDLRTGYGRGEALAELARRPAVRPARRLRAAATPGTVTAMAWRWPARIRGGRPIRLALLVLGAVALSLLAVIIDGGQPASLAIIAGAATWVLRGGRRYLGARAAGPAARAGAGPRRQ
jgi:curved DNA-binding protein CbpA